MSTPPRIHSGHVPFQGRYTADALEGRRGWVAEQTGAELSALAGAPPPASAVEGNVENHVGYVQLPVGAAGPLRIDGEFAQGTFFVPLATTEGALVASASRGARAITESGGVRVRVLSDQMMRAPSFIFRSLVDSVAFASWVRKEQGAIRAIAESQTRHGKLLSCDPTVLGDTVCLLMSYDTGDAYSANMVMRCNWAVCNYIVSTFPAQSGREIHDHYVDSNMGAEKKISFFMYTTSMRGKRVVAEAKLDRGVMASVLRTTPEDLFEAFVAGITPTAAAGSMGVNVNFANIVAAIFTACGQDIATVPESAQGQLNFRLEPDGLYFGCLMPNLVVGTVGGGTALPAQSAALDMLGCRGTGGAKKLAEIVCATCLALDLSTFSAICSDHFVRAHEKLGRNRPKTGPLGLPPQL